MAELLFARLLRVPRGAGLNHRRHKGDCFAGLKPREWFKHVENSSMSFFFLRTTNDRVVARSGVEYVEAPVLDGACTWMLDSNGVCAFVLVQDFHDAFEQSLEVARLAVPIHFRIPLQVNQPISDIWQQHVVVIIAHASRVLTKDCFERSLELPSKIDRKGTFVGQKCCCFGSGLPIELEDVQALDSVPCTSPNSLEDRHLSGDICEESY